jgi:hypothetical protein
MDNTVAAPIRLPPGAIGMSLHGLLRPLLVLPLPALVALTSRATTASQRLGPPEPLIGALLSLIALVLESALRMLPPRRP